MVQTPISNNQHPGHVRPSSRPTGQVKSSDPNPRLRRCAPYLGLLMYNLFEVDCSKPEEPLLLQEHDLVWIESVRRELTLIVTLSIEHIDLTIRHVVGCSHIDASVVRIDTDAVYGRYL